MRNFIYRRVREGERPPIWMARCYYDVSRRQFIFAAFPINLFIALLWWLQDRWAQAASAPSWIDREADARADQTLRTLSRARS